MSSTKSIKLIVGLGNPGPSYEDTRHNAGDWFVDQIAARNNQSLTEKSKFYGLVGKVIIANRTVHLLIPTTYMNLSGQAVCAMAKFYEIAPNEILIAHDEIDLEPGTIRYKFDGGHGGHNGLRNIAKALNTKEFYRLRIGVGRPSKGGDVADFVLKRPSKTEQTLIDDAIHDALAVLPEVVAGNTEKAMKALHTK
jgi:PTH1 family peptidyl-tRNA hydrolase